MKIINSNRGSILVAALLVASTILLVIGAYSARLISDYRMTDKAYHMSAAMNLAEAGLQHAVSELNYGDGSFAGWTASDGGATQEITVPSFTTPDGSICGGYNIIVTGANTDDVTVVTIGYSPAIVDFRSKKSIKAGLIRVEKSVFNMAVFGKESVYLKSYAQINSYNSTYGPYGGSNIAQSGNIGTNSTSAVSPYAITLASNAQIDGSVLIGPGGDTSTAIDDSSNVTITGTKGDLPEPKTFPDIYGPSGLPSMGSLNVGTGGATISSSGQYTSLTLSPNSALTVTGDVQLYITGTLALRSNTRIDVAAGASLEIYVDTKLDMHSNSQINNLNNDPTKCSIYGTSNYTGSLTFSSNTDFYGALYAPEASITLNSNADTYGCVIGKDVTIDSNGAVHYDEALGAGGYGPATGDYIYSVDSWAEITPA